MAIFITWIIEALLMAMVLNRWGGRALHVIPTLIPLIGLPFACGLPAPIARYTTFLLVYGTILLQAFLLARALDRLDELNSRRLAVLFLVIAAALLPQHLASPPFDDESMRLTAVVSWIDDRDMDLRDEYEDEEWREFRTAASSYHTELAGRFQNALAKIPGSFIPYHAIGFPILISEGYAVMRPFGPVWARAGATFPVMMAAAAGVALLARLLTAGGQDAITARRVSLLISLSAPWLFFADHIWAEPIALSAGLWLLSEIVMPRQSRLGPIAVGALAAVLPLLHFRYGVFSVTLLMIWLWHRRRDFASILWAAAGAAPVTLALLVNIHLRSDQSTLDIFTASLHEYPALPGFSDFDWRRLSSMHEIVIRLLVPPAGLLAYMPCLLIFTRRGSSYRSVALLATTGILATIFLYFPSGPLARFWVPIIPLLVIAATPRKPGVLWYSLASLGAAKGILIVAFPALCHDAVVVNKIVSGLFRPLAWLVIMALG